MNNECPCCDASFGFERTLIVHLMNLHNWTVNRIAQYLEIDMSKEIKK